MTINELRLGPALRFIVFAVVFAIFGAFIWFAALTWVKNETNETTTERLKLDGIQESRASKTTEERRAYAAEWFKNNRAYDDNGKPTPEFLQFMETESEFARQRGDQRDVIEKTTGVQIREFIGL